MNKSKLLSITLLILILINSTMVFASDLDKFKSEAEERGYRLGQIDGREKALENLSDNKTMSYEEALPTINEIIEEYPHFRYDFDYYDGYIKGFKEIYERIMGVESSDTDKEKINYANSLGRLLGETYGYRDFYSKVSSNWSKALPNSNNIIKMFNMENQTSRYKSAFFQEFREAFREYYEKAYEKANLEPHKLTLESGINDGETIGAILGQIHGAKDYFENKTNNYLRNIPRDSLIISDYALRKDYKEYSDSFLIGFKRAYEEAYNSGFREANHNVHLRDESDAYEDGRSSGLKKGEILASMDFIEKKENNWKNHRFLSSSIIMEHNLLYQSSKYGEGFISGYWEGFAEGYSNAYKALHQESLGQKSLVANLPMAGGEVTSAEGTLAVNIKEGTYYNSIIVSIEKMLHNPYKINKNRFIESSGTYNIQIGNSSGNMDNSRPIDISFEYYGKSNGGIYKRTNNGWTYLNSIIKDGQITTSVKPSSLADKENIFTVLIDKELPILQDIRSHWAKDEISALVRRDIIYGYTDHNFKPDKEISRVEFLALLSRIYDWKLDIDISDAKKLKDYEKFGPNEKLINHGLVNGYIKGYDDNTFKPNNPITYKEVEIIMGRVLQDPSFKWHNISAKMLYEKQVKSNSYESMSNKINRAEVSYMLYILNEWRY